MFVKGTFTSSIISTSLCHREIFDHAAEWKTDRHIYSNSYFTTNTWNFSLECIFYIRAAFYVSEGGLNIRNKCENNTVQFKHSKNTACIESTPFLKQLKQKAEHSNLHQSGIHCKTVVSHCISFREVDFIKSLSLCHLLFIGMDSLGLCLYLCLCIMRDTLIQYIVDWYQLWSLIKVLIIAQINCPVICTLNIICRHLCYEMVTITFYKPPQLWSTLPLDKYKNMYMYISLSVHEEEWSQSAQHTELYSFNIFIIIFTTYSTNMHM